MFWLSTFSFGSTNHTLSLARPMDSHSITLTEVAKNSGVGFQASLGDHLFYTLTLNASTVLLVNASPVTPQRQIMEPTTLCWLVPCQEVAAAFL
jgi:hypothetical protein